MTTKFLLDNQYGSSHRTDLKWKWFVYHCQTICTKKPWCSVANTKVGHHQKPLGRNAEEAKRMLKLLRRRASSMAIWKIWCTRPFFERHMKAEERCVGRIFMGEVARDIPTRTAIGSGILNKPVVVCILDLRLPLCGDHTQLHRQRHQTHWSDVLGRHRQKPSMPKITPSGWWNMRTVPLGSLKWVGRSAVVWTCAMK